jgi:hypothetical protein
MAMVRVARTIRPRARQAIDKDGGHGQCAATGLFSSDEYGLEEISPHIADGDEIEEIAEKSEPKRIAQGERNSDGSDQLMPANKADADTGEEGSEGESDEWPLNGPFA